MTVSRTSNEERSKYRYECRCALSEHLCRDPLLCLSTLMNEGERLKLTIEPSHVRLNPGRSDPYAWKVLPGKEETLSKIFSKNLSDHSITALKELRAGVGVTFEAVLKPCAGALHSPFPLRCEPSFNSIIDGLSKENSRLSRELQELKSEIATESERRKRAEHLSNQKEEECESLRRQVGDYAILTSDLRSRASDCCQELERIVPVLAVLKETAVKVAPIYA